jgi:hypothetical protein
MAYCKICGATMDEVDTVCSNCGTPVSAAAMSQAEISAQTARSAASTAGSNEPVVGSWAFVGSILLLGIPVVGLIVAIIWAAGAVSNRNLRNLARANLLLLLIWTALLLSALLSILMKFGSILYFANYLVGLFG